jgi:hypothetical protein
MKLTIEPTNEFVEVEGGTVCRLWRTCGDDGRNALLLVASCAVPVSSEHACAEFERELIELCTPVEFKTQPGAPKPPESS